MAPGGRSGFAVPQVASPLYTPYFVKGGVERGGPVGEYLGQEIIPHPLGCAGRWSQGPLKKWRARQMYQTPLATRVVVTNALGFKASALEMEKNQGVVMWRQVRQPTWPQKLIQENTAAGAKTRYSQTVHWVKGYQSAKSSSRCNKDDQCTNNFSGPLNEWRQSCTQTRFA